MGAQPDGVLVDESGADDGACHERGISVRAPGRDMDRLPPRGGNRSDDSDRSSPSETVAAPSEPRRKRGQPSRASECAFDAGRAIRELEVARELYTLANDTGDPHFRAERMRAAHDRAGQAGRFIAFLLARPPR